MFRGTPAVGELELTIRKWENWSLQIESKRIGVYRKKALYLGGGHPPNPPRGGQIGARGPRPPSNSLVITILLSLKHRLSL